MSGLIWLCDGRYGRVPFCLTFVRGGGADAVFTGFGADPAAAVPMAWNGAEEAAVVRVAAADDWLVAIETSLPPQGVRPEVLRRISAGTEAVSVCQDPGKGNHRFAYAADGRVVSAVMTTIPPQWTGSDPGRLAGPARELGMAATVAGLMDLRVLLALGERAFGLSVEEDLLDRTWPGASVLPVLADLPPARPASSPAKTGDPVIDLLLDHTTPQAITSVLRVRAGRLITAAGLDEFAELTAAVQRALNGGPDLVSDDEPTGIALRKLAHEGEQAEVNRWHPRGRSLPRADLERSIRRGKTASVLRFILAGRLRQSLVNEMSQQMSWDPDVWRDQALADLMPMVQVPLDEMEAAERQWQETRHLPNPAGRADVGPVRRHLELLLEGGMTVDRVAALTGMTPIGVEGILNGRTTRISGHRARRILTTEIP